MQNSQILGTEKSRTSPGTHAKSVLLGNKKVRTGSSIERLQVDQPPENLVLKHARTIADCAGHEQYYIDCDACVFSAALLQDAAFLRQIPRERIVRVITEFNDMMTDPALKAELPSDQ